MSIKGKKGSITDLPASDAILTRALGRAVEWRHTVRVDDLATREKLEEILAEGDAEIRCEWRPLEVKKPPAKAAATESRKRKRVTDTWTLRFLHPGDEPIGAPGKKGADIRPPIAASDFVLEGDYLHQLLPGGPSGPKVRHLVEELDVGDDYGRGMVKQVETLKGKTCPDGILRFQCQYWDDEGPPQDESGKRPYDVKLTIEGSTHTVKCGTLPEFSDDHHAVGHRLRNLGMVAADEDGWDDDTLHHPVHHYQRTHGMQRSGKRQEILNHLRTIHPPQDG